MNKIIRLILIFCFNAFQIIPDFIALQIIRFILKLGGYRKQVINKNFNSTIGNEYPGLKFDSFYNSNIKFVARLIVESLSTLSTKKQDKIQFSNLSFLESKSTNSILLLASHYGNWELACTMLPLHTDLPCYGVYKPLKNKAIDRFMLNKRSKHGLNLIPMKKIGRTILENKHKGIKAIYILIADQNPNSKNSIIWSNFLGVKTAFFNGPVKLYQKYKFDVAYMKVKALDELFNYKIEIKTDIKLGQDGDEIINSYSNLLESQIQEAPQYWLWSHKRWKRTF